MVAGGRPGVGDHVPRAPSGLGPEPEPEIGDWDEALAGAGPTVSG